METKYLFPETSDGVMGEHVGVIYEVFDESGKMLRKQKKILFPETRKQMGSWWGSWLTSGLTLVICL